MTRKWVVVVFFLFSSLAAGQSQIRISHILRESKVPLPSQTNQSSPVDTIRILAIMVEFQADNNDRTTGDGAFLIQGSQAQIDPPPHDSLYFRNKIRFVENYFRKVSDGKLTIIGDVLGRRIILSKQMLDYAPPTTRTDNKKLADLAAESWTKANSEYPGLSFSSYDLFVLFHAGVGRDIDMVSILANNPTPYDIPSLYLDSTAFAAALGEPSFNGLVNGFIKNTIILPETESRVLLGDTLQLSINGLFAASVGSYLRLPDLFDTKTGRSGIGQFGLMDGAGIFAYRGLFPPEPSAWEKIQLGWVTPQLVQNSSALSLPAVGLKAAGRQDVIYKIPVSSSEYFLLENRSRDPEENGQKLTVVKNGMDTYRYIPDDSTAFIYYDTTGISGSVVDAEDFDWAMVSWLDTLGIKYHGGGILIWHIDENVIQAGLQTNTINADIGRRGIELKEADGSKDIGQDYDEFTYGYGTENGSPFDCWFSDNYAYMYKNTFDRNSFPNSSSHSGAASLITINNFSQRSPQMSVNVEIGSNVLQKDSAFHKSFANIKTFPTSTKEHLYIPADNGISAFKNDGSGLVNSNPVLTTAAPDYSVAAYKLSDNMEVAASVRDSILDIINIPLTNGPISINSVITGNRFSTPPSIAYLDSLCILVGAESGSFFKFSLDGRLMSKRSAGAGAVSSIALLPVSSNSYQYFFTAGNRFYSEQDSVDLPASSNAWILAAAVSPGKGNFIAALEKNGSKVISFSQSLTKIFEVSTKSPAIQEAAIADIDGDGEKDIIVQSSSYLSVFNRIGLPLDGFPISAKSGLEFTGTPLVVDFDGDDKPEIILLTNDGEIWVYKANGKLLSGFPVQAASQGKAFPVVYKGASPSNKLGIAVLTEKGAMDAFLSNTPVSGKEFYWWQYLGDERHLNADTSVTILRPISTEFFPKSRVYNWPNPVYGRSTQIRYYTSEDAAITVTILDLSGVKITELKGRGIAGMDNEITWDVSKIQSGIYLARVEAQGAAKNNVTVIKIAVVK